MANLRLLGIFVNTISSFLKPPYKKFYTLLKNSKLSIQIAP